MSPLISLLEKETIVAPHKHEHHNPERSASGHGCAGGPCACVKPCANCACRDKKER